MLKPKKKVKPSGLMREKSDNVYKLRQLGFYPDKPEKKISAEGKAKGRCLRAIEDRKAAAEAGLTLDELMG